MITVNLYYTGSNGSARAFADEMVSSGIAALREKYDLHMKVERFVSDEALPEQDLKFIKR